MNESDFLFGLLADLALGVGYHPSVDTHLRVRFTNGVACKDDLYLIGTDEGPIATKDQYENCKCSFAHLEQGGRVMRHHEQIATRSELLIWNPLQLHE